MTKQRKHYETAFKLEVARMVVDQGNERGTSRQRHEDRSHRSKPLDRAIPRRATRQAGHRQIAHCRAASHPHTFDREPPTALRQ